MANESKTVEEYLIVINHEEQYSIWPSFKSIPKGWTQVDIPGSKEECLNYIKNHWTDMRPLSVRKEMEQLDLENNQLLNKIETQQPCL